MNVLGTKATYFVAGNLYDTYIVAQIRRLSHEKLNYIEIMVSNTSSST